MTSDAAIKKLGRRLLKPMGHMTTQRLADAHIFS
jgi:hypothetical protein